ncbi:MAG: hypothetical protein OEY14_07670, partial [Myxococcales bacterium]|nr:hypothetical protein [Myxococcales bacterium]
SRWDAYGCAPGTDEGGPEWIYLVEVLEIGVLGVSVLDDAGVDIDVHILDAADPEACLDRHDQAARALVGPGRYYIVADSWVDAGGVVMAGAYSLEIRFRPVPEIDCATRSQDLPMFWSACAPGIDCYQALDAAGVLQTYLRTPAIGAVALEAHLVVEGDAIVGWPVASRDGLEGHYALSQASTEYVMARREPWAPAGEGGSMWGQGATGLRLPDLEESWYVNMYWRQRPAPGTRMLVRDPLSGLAVVAAAGYETGPGANTAVGGAVEEIHDYLGTTHLDTLEMGFLDDPLAPLGPVICR